jgi:hypothetical protein
MAREMQEMEDCTFKPILSAKGDDRSDSRLSS